MHPLPLPPAAFAALVVAAALCGAGGCKDKVPVELWVDGFEPENVRFEIEDLGPRPHDELLEMKGRRDIDGALLLEADACGGPCRAAVVSVFVHNKGRVGDEGEPPPVVRLKAPKGKPERLPIAFRGDEISKGRVGRVRWLVEMWPEEQRLVATLSSSVRLVEPPAMPPIPAPPATPATPATPPPPPTPGTP